MLYCDTCSFPVEKNFFRGRGGARHSHTCDKCVRLGKLEDEAVGEQGLLVSFSVLL